MSSVRAGLTESAVRLASHVGYANAGTVEFILDEAGRYYFMEVNTRLQVEHPVTELRTGLDLVREQILVASGERLSLTQRDVRFDGHALECRIYAEDSSSNFIPFIGTIGHIAHPSGPGIRVDTGIETGSAISAYYDPMISKVIAHGADRGESLAIMVRALERYEIHGVRTNIDLLLWILADPDFSGGAFDTNFLGRKYRPEMFDRTPPEIRELAADVAALLQVRSDDRVRAGAHGHDPGWTSARSGGLR